MQRAAIVPYDQIADAPAMAIDKALLRGKSGEFFEKRSTLLNRPSDNVRCFWVLSVLVTGPF